MHFPYFFLQQGISQQNGIHFADFMKDVESLYRKTSCVYFPVQRGSSCMIRFIDDTAHGRRKHTAAARLSQQFACCDIAAPAACFRQSNRDIYRDDNGSGDFLEQFLKRRKYFCTDCTLWRLAGDRELFP